MLEPITRTKLDHICITIFEKIVSVHQSQRDEVGRLTADGSLRQYDVDMEITKTEWLLIRDLFGSHEIVPEENKYRFSTEALTAVKEQMGFGVFQCIAEQIVDFNLKVVEDDSMLITVGGSLTPVLSLNERRITDDT